MNVNVAARKEVKLNITARKEAKLNLVVTQGLVKLKLVVRSA